MNDNDTINIAGLDRAAVLAALVNGSRSQGMGALQDPRRAITVAEAQQMIDRSMGLSFDYVCGRVIKCDLSGDTLDPRLYDRDLGLGAARRALAELLNG